MSDRPGVSETDLQAYVDGRSAPGRRAEVEDWLASHPEDAERVAAYRSQSDQLRAFFAPELDEPVPAHLLRSARRGSGLRAHAVAAGWVVLGLALGALAGWHLHAWRPAASNPQVQSTPISKRAALAHATYSPEVRHPVEVGADQEAHLVAWLSKRLGAKVRAPNLEPLGYSLMGGRLLPGDPANAGFALAPVAQFMFQCKGGTRITLYMRTEVPGPDETAFRYSQEGNVKVFYWIDRSFGYALSSADIDKEMLLSVANSVYQQFNPP